MKSTIAMCLALSYLTYFCTLVFNPIISAKHSYNKIICNLSNTPVNSATLCASATKDDNTTICLSLISSSVPKGNSVTVAHHMDDWITRGTQKRGNYLTGLTDVFQKALSHDGFGISAKGKLILDIGGNIGLFTAVAAAHGARVETFEPGARNRKKISITVFANSFHRVNVHPIGLGAQTSPMMVYFDPASLVFNSDGVVVKGPDDPLITTLRSSEKGTATASRSCCKWYLEPVLISTLDIANTNNKLAGAYFVKIDVEGFESLVFAGGKTFFQTIHPKYVFFEVNWKLWHGRREMPHWMSVSDTIVFLEAIGYEVYDANTYFKNKRRITPGHTYKSNQYNPDYLAVFRG